MQDWNRGKLDDENRKLRGQLAEARVQADYPGVDLDEVRRLADNDPSRFELAARALYAERGPQSPANGARVEPHGVPLPPSNLTDAAITAQERRFLEIQRKNKNSTERRQIDYVDADWMQKVAFSELLMIYGNDPDFGTKNVRDFLKNVDPRRDLHGRPKR
jgi:hypothetical protein